MPWRDPISLSFTHIDIVSSVPSESGVYGILDGSTCIFVGESWNLRARLLELASVISDTGQLTITFELCSEEECAGRKVVLAGEHADTAVDHTLSLPPLPGLILSTLGNR